MEIPEEHKRLLLEMGVREEELALFDGKTLSYEYRQGKGVRLYDPFCKTSTTRYIEVDGWTSWSSEDEDFMDLLFPQGPPRRAEAVVEGTGKEALNRLKEKFSEEDKEAPSGDGVKEEI